MNPRILRTLGALAAVPLLVAAPSAAHAADDGGRIDHVETDGGSVSVLYSVPGLPSGVTPDPESVTVTMDGKPVEATAKTVADSGETVRRTAILAIDVSKSMEGDKFAAAQDAARAYVEAAPDDVYIGLVTFASDVTTVEAPTQNHDDLDEAISSLELTPATHLYDGVLQALDETGEEGQRSVLVLSDGIDTTDTELSTVVTQAKNTEPASTWWRSTRRSPRTRRWSRSRRPPAAPSPPRRTATSWRRSSPPRPRTSPSSSSSRSRLLHPRSRAPWRSAWTRTGRRTAMTRS